MGYALLLDIGNTNIKIGLTDGQKLLTAFSLPSSREHTSDSLGLLLADLLRLENFATADLEVVLACSVVPSLNPILRAACGRYLKTPIKLVPEDVPLPLENHYSEPSQVGADRLVGAYAARRMFPEAASIICVDYGTATTFDCLEGNAYLGGLICPGVHSSATALSSKTAKLPVVSLETGAARPEPGKSTSTSINHGFIFGFASMTEGLCRKLKDGLKAPVVVLGTGGFATPLSRVTDCFDAVKSDLLLEGLRFLYADGI